MNLYDSRILLIDDNIELADMIRDMLRRTDMPMFPAPIPANRECACSARNSPSL